MKKNKTVLKPASSLKNKSISEWKKMVPVIDYDKCIGCGKCELFCPDNAIYKDTKNKTKKGLPTFKHDNNYCKGCGICAEICPVKAIKMVPIKQLKNNK